MVVRHKKLIEVALPLDSINQASAKEKSIRQGHPSTLHLWWARRPLATARAVIFAQMVDDPSAHPELFPTTASQDEERQRLFSIMVELVKWENTSNQALLQMARDEIWASWRKACEANSSQTDSREIFDQEVLPAFHDPFAGGGALPLEAQRLGLISIAGDLNPVAVTINKAMIEVPGRFSGFSPVNPSTKRSMGSTGVAWKGLTGFVEDVRHYGEWVRTKVSERLESLYPTVVVSSEMLLDRPDLDQYAGKNLKVIAWIWARTVKSPNPAFSEAEVPLASTFMLSTKKGKEAYVQPVVSGKDYRFVVRTGTPTDLAEAKSGTKSGSRSFKCLLSGVPIPYEYIDSEANAGRMGERLMAIVAEGEHGRVYLSPSPEQVEAARSASPTWIPETPSRGTWASNAQGRRYGFQTFGDYFTRRQLVALTSLSDIICEVKEDIEKSASENLDGNKADTRSLHENGIGPRAYSEAVALYLALALDKTADYNSTICSWISGGQTMRNTFGRQAMPMTWDYAEANPIGSATGSFASSVSQVSRTLLLLPAQPLGSAFQSPAQTEHAGIGRPVISTDPPYYDNVGYADLSDYFYVWLRRTARTIFPDLFSTLAVPKTEELIADVYRHHDRKAAEQFFLSGMTDVMRWLVTRSHPAFPVTIYYAFKQSESKVSGGVTRTGWETFLGAVVEAGFSISGTWPMRTEMANRMISSGTNALASSIVLVCRPQSDTAQMATRAEFLRTLREELGDRIRLLQSGNVAPVDLPQSSIGPGMEIFTRFSRVLESDGTKMSVGAALSAINDVLEEVLTEQEGEYDPPTRWAISWFEQHGMGSGSFGDADNLARARNTAIDGLERARILESGGGKVRLLKPSELVDEWSETQAGTVTVWEAAHRIIRSHDTGGVDEAGRLVSRLGGEMSSRCKDLAYRLYSVCESNSWSENAISYNGVVAAWPAILRSAESQTVEQQGTLI